jgi:hypothetical protein
MTWIIAARMFPPECSEVRGDRLDDFRQPGTSISKLNARSDKVGPLRSGDNAQHGDGGNREQNRMDTAHTAQHRDWVAPALGLEPRMQRRQVANRTISSVRRGNADTVVGTVRLAFLAGFEDDRARAPRSRP